MAVACTFGASIPVGSTYTEKNFVVAKRRAARRCHPSISAATKALLAREVTPKLNEEEH
jgi:hypothetical protein